MADIVYNDSSVNDIKDNYITLYSNSHPSIAATVRFWILLFLEIPSIFCSIFLLYNLYFDRILRQVLNNHVIFVILIVGLFAQAADASNYLTYLHLGYVWPQTTINCYVWWFIGAASYNLLGMLMAWTSIERHIIIFHHRRLNTQKKRIFIHYIPLISIVLYACIFYIICIFFVSCQNTPDYTQLWCFRPCYLGIFNLNLFDSLINSMLPLMLIVIVNILLVIRFIKQRQRLRPQIQWYKYRRMIIQVLSCSLLYLIFNFPVISMNLALIFGLPYGSTGEFEIFIYFFSFFIPVLMPFICLGSSKEIWIKMKKNRENSTYNKQNFSTSI
ncbi:unnamed protein product [Adineta steineri]|uniref:G-protein coupled receptors family 1 profile domain-containing protein n=1 Tax=Adineta steineri TaxID=433720 RepID=A0A815DMU7_9BILA|nr:unnamed protein product [Adineta steineri]CAF1575423.1 unnamed protein product [Adineta steineri]